MMTRRKCRRHGHSWVQWETQIGMPIYHCRRWGCPAQEILGVVYETRDGQVTGQ